jgi:hypothetical protein
LNEEKGVQLSRTFSLGYVNKQHLHLERFDIDFST